MKVCVCKIVTCVNVVDWWYLCVFRMPILTFDRLKKRRAGSTVMLLKKEQQHFDEHVEQPAMLVVGYKMDFSFTQ